MKGYLKALDNPEVYVPGAAASDLGKTFLIDTTYFKVYGCCRWTHSAIDAVLELRESGIKPQTVRDIEISTFRRALSLKHVTQPRDLIAAQFSLPFTVAVALVEGSAALLPLNPAVLGRKDIIEVAERVSLKLDPEIDSCFPSKVPARVRLRTAAGEFEREVRTPLGDPANPLSDERLVRKSVRLFAEVKTEEEVRALARDLFSWNSARKSKSPDLMKSVMVFLRQQNA
jgi:2-methylcitrate dehydratase PrpD